MGTKSSAPPPPDYSGIAQANDKASQLAYQAAQNDLAFRKQVYAESKPREQQLYDLASQVANQQMDIANQNQAHANQQWQQYQDTYRPNELQTAADAYGASYLGGTDNALLTSILSGNSGLSPSDAQAALNTLSQKAVQAAGSQAMTRAGAAANSQVAQARRGLQRLGGDPNRMAAYSTQLANAGTLAEVGAKNQAMESTQDKLMGLRTGVANFGRNMPNTAGQAFGLATQAGSAATANQGAGFNAGLPYAQFTSGAYGTGLNAAQVGSGAALGMGNLMNNTYGNQISGYNAQQQANGAFWGGLGQLGGMLGYGLIDRSNGK